MKILNLVLRKEPFDEILNGSKTSEYRMIRPWSPYLNHFKDGKPISGIELCKLAFPLTEQEKTDADEFFLDDWNKMVEKKSDLSIFYRVGGDTEVIEYDAIQFWHGYSKNRRGMLVENLKGQEELRFGLGKGSDGRICIGFTGEIHKGEGIMFPVCEIEYKLGKILKKVNC